MDIEIGSVATPQHGITELHQVRLSDAETKEPIGQVATIELAQQKDGFVLELLAPEIEASQLGKLFGHLHERLLCQGRGTAESFEIHAGEVTLIDLTASRTLVNVQASLTGTESGAQLSGSFQWADSVNSEENIRWSVSRNRDLSPPETSITVATGDDRLPCHLVARLWPHLARLGPEAEFSGTVAWRGGENGAGELSGALYRVDLDSLVSEHFPHVLSGKGTVRFESAIIEQGRVVSASGKFEVPKGGRISRSLLAAAAEHLELQHSAQSGREVMAYRRLACEFRIQGPLLRVAGTADPGTPGVVIFNPTSPLLTAPAKHSVPAVNLARALLPESQLQVPLASETSGLIQLLAAPQSAHVGHLQTARGSHVPTRLSPERSGSQVIRER